MRCRSHKNPFVTVSNTTAQGNDLSWELLGFLTFCLSMPEYWDFDPKQIWKSQNGRGAGINKIHAFFKDLMKCFRCIRIQETHLRNSYLYEIFDNPEDCKKRI